MVFGVDGACNVNAATVLGDDAFADPEAESGAAFALGGEEGLEEFAADLFRDAGTVVDDVDAHPGPVSYAVGEGSGRQGVGLDPDVGGRIGGKVGVIEVSIGIRIGGGLTDGFGGVGEQVGEDLAELGGEALNVDSFGELGGDVDAERVEAAVEEQEDGLERLFEIDRDGGAGLAIEAEHGARDLGDAINLLAREEEELRVFFGGALAVHQEEQV